MSEVMEYVAMRHEREEGRKTKTLLLTIPIPFVEESGVGRIIRGRWGHLEGCSGSIVQAFLNGKVL